MDSPTSSHVPTSAAPVSQSKHLPTGAKPGVIRVEWMRWGVCALLFFATTINYIDRQVIGILKPELERIFGWSEIDYGNIVFCFQLTLIGLAASAHQGFSANLFTMVSDTAPRQLVSSIVGIGGMAAAIGGMGIAKLAGYILEWTGHYLPLFVIASCAYLVALLAIHLLNPRLEPMRTRDPA